MRPNALAIAAEMTAPPPVARLNALAMNAGVPAAVTVARASALVTTAGPFAREKTWTGIQTAGHLIAVQAECRSASKVGVPDVLR